MARVLSSDEANASIARFASILNGGLTDEISRLESEGRVLSQPEVWDGPTAANFRSIWADTSRNLNAVLGNLEQLRNHVQVTNTNIHSAGGSL